ncbi:MAG: stage III sporulation protein AD [Lachnospiraceae bacterium]|nr:stage III sporulation protein AD [Lachnospiraceae bacterium]
MEIVKIGLLAITAVLLGLMIRSVKPEFGILIGITACTCIFILLIHKVEMILDYIDTIWQLIPVDSRYIGLILKMIGISYIAEFSTDICKDAGYQTIAGQIEIFAKLSIVLVSMPVMMSFLEVIGEFL